MSKSRSARRAPRFVLATVLLAVGCGTNPPQPSGPRTAERGPRIIFPDGYAVTVEVAADDPTRTQGLMFRDNLPGDRGMIVLFRNAGDYPFWMKNTLIPLDMIWLDDQKRIVHVGHDVPPCTADPCPSYPPNAVARYVLEVAAGVAARHGLANGQTLRFEGLENVVVR